MPTKVDGIVQHSVDQKQADGDDPVCVLCGRYGEYVCDQTDEDVCSLECRDRCIERYKASTKVQTSEQLLRKELGIHVKHVNCDGSQLQDTTSPLLTEFMSTEDGGTIPKQLYTNMQERGYNHPTPVQIQTIPTLLDRQHAVLSAPTGTGKTIAYLIPLVIHIVSDRECNDIGCYNGLVLSPVRELAIQIEMQAKVIMQGIPNMKTALIVGGYPLPPQLYRLRQHVQLIVATPGRLLDVIQHYSDEQDESLLSCVQYCVVDEVDMMLNVGFRDQIIQIIGLVCSKAQFCFVSATISDAVERMIQQWLGSTSSYVRIRVEPMVKVAQKSLKESLIVPSHIQQHVYWIEEVTKKHSLFEFLHMHNDASILVFVASKSAADMLAEAIGKHCGIRAMSIHAGKSQKQRYEALEQFIEQNVRVLVSTNVLGRGMDLLVVEYVIVFDAPSSIEEYIHLVGRAGRSMETVANGERVTGEALIYVNNRDEAIFSDLESILRTAHIHVPEQIYTALRAQYNRKLASSNTEQRTIVAIDESKRAFHVRKVIESDRNQNDGAREWREWVGCSSNQSTKRQRVT